MPEKPMEVGAFHRIPASWWNLLLDGHLWLVTEDLLPFKPWDWNGASFIYAFRYQARSRGLRGSCRRLPQKDASDPWKIYVQKLDHEVRLQTGKLRIPLHEAVQAPVVPYLTEETDGLLPAPRVRDYSTSIIRMLHKQAADRVENPASAKELIPHPLLNWLEKYCDCDSPNFREHPYTCGAYSMLGLLEFDMQKLNEPPEEWLMRHRHRR